MEKEKKDVKRKYFIIKKYMSIPKYYQSKQK